MVFSKKTFTVILSKLEVFDNPKVMLEQYPTDSEVAGDFLWNAALNGDVKDKVIADFGAGTGILGIGALLLGAKKVFFVEKDPDAMQILVRNYEKIESEYEIGEAEFIKQDMNDFDKEVDVVIQNPPFGTKDEHADKKFLEKAFKTANTVYSLHKEETESFLDKISQDSEYKITHRYRYDFLLKKTMAFHKKKLERIKVIGVKINKL